MPMLEMAFVVVVEASVAVVGGKVVKRDPGVRCSADIELGGAADVVDG